VGVGVLMNISPFNGLKCLAQADKINKILDGSMPYPTCAQVDVTNICNHHCVWCFYQSFKDRETVQMPTKKVLSLIDELHSLGVKSILFTGGGEPLMHPDICKILRYAKKLDFKIGMSTNGGMLGDVEIQNTILECNTYLRVSLDAGTDKVHSKLHGVPLGSYSKILSNIKSMNERRTTDITIGYAFLIGNENYFDIDSAVWNAVSNGFDYIQFRPIIGSEISNEARAVADYKIKEMKGLYFDFNILGTVDRFVETKTNDKCFTKCRATPLITIIGADQKVYLCCQWRGNLKYVVGDISNKSFKEVWDSEHHRKLVESIDVKKCYPCKYKNYNIVIEEVFVKNKMHVDFL